MQGILLIYLYYSAADGGLGIQESTATSIVGAYGAALTVAGIFAGRETDES
jgi:POT family proton-dependent oligopeptide transporter